MFIINREKQLAIAVDGNNGIWMLCNITRGTCSVGNVASKLMLTSRYDEIVALSKTIDPTHFVQIGSNIISQNMKRICPGAKAGHGVIYYPQVTGLFCEKPELKKDLRKFFHTKEEFDMFIEYFPVTIETVIKYSDSGVIIDGMGFIGCFVVAFDASNTNAVAYAKLMSRVYKANKGKFSLEDVTEFHKILQEKDKNLKNRNMNLWGDFVQKVGTCYNNLHEALVGYHNTKIQQ